MNDNEPNDEQAWLEELASVKPLKQQDRVMTQTPVETDATVFAARRAAAEIAPGTPSPLTLGWVPSRTPHEIMGFKRDGVQEGVYKKLRLGGYVCEGVLDLHRKTLVEAADSVYQFVQRHFSAGHRMVRIIHGRGIRSQPEPAMLKRYCAQWLMEVEFVIAYHSAQPKDGGAGALYVLLRKNPERKAINRQRHQQRKG